MCEMSYIELSLGSSGTEYIAPDNGWFYIAKYMGTNAELQISNNTGSIASRYLTTSDNRVAHLYVPATKDDIITVGYANTGKTSTFRFIYAHGTNIEKD